MSLVKDMRMTEKQMKHMAVAILDGLKEQKVVEFKDKESAVLDRAIAIIKADYAREAQLDREVNAMMDMLEKQNTGEPFQRYIMFPMLKKRLAKEKKIIL